MRRTPAGWRPTQMSRPAVGLLVAGLLNACSTGPSAEPVPGVFADAPDSEPPPSLLAHVRAGLDSGQYVVTARLADSLYYAWRLADDREAFADSALWLEAEALDAAGRTAESVLRLRELLTRDIDSAMREAVVVRLAALLVELAREPEAVELLLAGPVPNVGGWRAILVRATSEMSLGELGSVPGTRAPGSTAEALVAAEYAAALYQVGRSDEAAGVARAVVTQGGDSAAVARATSVLDGSVESARGPIKVGAILPLSGRFATVGQLLQAGIRLALGEQAAIGGTRVELVLRDDGSDPTRAAALVRELEEEGVVAVIGPIRSQAFGDAGAGRGYVGLLVVSPTATEVDNPAPNTYTLWDAARREADVSLDVGRWLATELDLSRLAALVPASDEGRDALLAFRAGAEHAGAIVTAYATYSADSTTFATPIRVVASFRPQAVFVAAGDASEALQMGPQLSFYGLRDVVVIGGPGWAEPTAVRRLEPTVADYRLVATFVDQFNERGAWFRFKRLYETTYRMSLRDNMLPALGHDAMSLVLAALPADGLARRGALSRTFRRLGPFDGASGELRPDTTGSTVSRRTLVRMIHDRSLVEPDPEAIAGWLSEVQAIEGARLRHRQTEAADAVARGERPQ